MTADAQQPFPLLDKNSLGIPAVCDEYVEVADMDALRQAVSVSKQMGQAIFILGEGTNVVFSSDFHGKIIRPVFKGIQIIRESESGVLIRIGAGENWHQLVCWAMERGFYGLENLALIPGSCGAAPVQNIGAYGVEINQLLISVEYFDLESHEQKTLTNDECGFGYRDSRFKQDLLDKTVITHISLALSKAPEVQIEYPALKDYLEEHGKPPTPQNVFDAVCEIRRSKLPDIYEIPNVGSFFKNPVVDSDLYSRITQEFPDCPGYQQSADRVKIPAAWLIDKCGWKGKSQSGVGVHDRQALVIVNPGHRKGEHIMQFAGQIQREIASTFGIDLQIEPRVLP